MFYYLGFFRNMSATRYSLLFYFFSFHTLKTYAQTYSTIIYSLVVLSLLCRSGG
jgi:hypothetical protein